MQQIPAALFGSMLSESLAHPLVGPVPLKGMRVQAVILRPRDLHMLQKLLPATPGTTLQITPTEGPDEQFRLIQPGSMDGRKAGPHGAPLRWGIYLLGASCRVRNTHGRFARDVGLHHFITD